MVLIVWDEVITWKIMRLPSWLGWPLLSICVTNDRRYVLFVVITILVCSTTGDTSGVGTNYPSGAHEFTTVFSVVTVVQSSLVFCVVFCRFFFFFIFFFWSLYCLSFIDLRFLIVITPFVSSNLSYIRKLTFYLLEIYYWYKYPLLHL